MYKLIACDLDETLLTTDKEVSETNKEAIRKVEEAGIKFVIATGRGIEDVKTTSAAIDQDGREGEYVISFNGGAVTENKENEFLFTNPLTFEFADELYQIGQKYDVSIHVYTKEDLYIYNYKDAERAHLEPEIEVIETFEKDLDFLADEEIIKIIFMNEDHDYLEKIESDLSEILGDCDVSYSSNRYLEFNRKGANKGAALEYLAAHLGIAMSETLVIGDNFNDHSMFKVAGLSVGVENMREELREEVDYITEATNDEHAVAEVIDRFILSPAKIKSQ